MKEAANTNVRYSLIIVDHFMPIMDGTEASNKIRKFIQSKNMDQPYIVACTGRTEDIYIRDAWQHGIDEIIPKPAKIQIMQQLLEEIIIE